MQKKTNLFLIFLLFPHFYVFNIDRKLIYTGRAVDTPRDASKITVNNLEDALIMTLDLQNQNTN